MVLECYLNELEPGEGAVVMDLPEDGALRRRLEAFGMAPRIPVRCRYWGPGRHLMALELRGALIALRRRDLSRIPVWRL